MDVYINNLRDKLLYATKETPLVNSNENQSFQTILQHNNSEESNYSDSLELSKNSYQRSVSYRIFFKNIEKETANQTVELISNKNKKLKFWNELTFSKKYYKVRFFYIFS